MTELFIDGQRVTLPQDVKWTFIEQNPFLSKNGTYTYDITLSLRDKCNAKIYGHIQRKNYASQLPTTRSAVLIVDNHVILNGSEVILEKTESEVSIQLVSGNSELNYISGSDLKIRQLDLGRELLYTTVFSEDSALWMINQMDRYLTDGHFALPFANSENTDIGNRWYIYKVTGQNQYKIRFTYDGQVRFTNSEGVNTWAANVRPQPYLHYIVNLILEQLGYAVVENQMKAHDVLKLVYIVHGFDTIDWALMLPDWTVSEFFTQLEQFAGCTLVVDNITKEARIILNQSSTNFAVKEIVVEDEYTDKIDNSQSIETYHGKNVGYSLDSDEYYKFTDITDEITNAAELVDLTGNSDVLDVMDALVNLVNDNTDPFRFSKIFQTDFGNFIAYKDGSIVYPKEINTLSPAINNANDETTIDIELKILPAPMKVVKMPIYTQASVPVDTGSYFYMQLPFAENVDKLLTFDENGYHNYEMQALISGTDSLKSSALADKMRVALFAGRKQVDAFTSSGVVISPSTIQQFPMCFIRSMAEYFRNLNTRRLYFGNVMNPLSPKTMYEGIYSQGVQIDNAQGHVFTFIRPVNLSAMNIFLISGRKYLCERIEFDVDSDGFGKICKGTFYPII